MFSKLKKTFVCTLSFVMLFVTTACDSNNEAEKKGDFISGNKWVTTSEMMLSLETDGTFKWYQSKNNRKDNFFSGTFTVYVGQNAIDYLNEQLGSTEEAQLAAMQKYSITLDEYYVLNMTNKECIEGGKNTLEEPNSIIYCGYYLSDYETLKITNMANGTSYEWTKM